MKPGTLYVIGTPIGNLDDLTLRGIETLRRVDTLACEDTRSAMKILKRLDLHKPLLSFFEHSPASRQRQLIDLLTQGKDVGLISEAGTPLISDPGARLVDEALTLGLPVVPIPGPSAVTAAASVSGMSISKFVFEGFLPRRPGRRRRALEALKKLERPIILFESPYRVVATLEAIRDVFGDCTVLVGRELTKMFEEIRRGPVAEMIERYRKGTKGEFTIIVQVSASDSTTPPIGEGP